MSVVLSLKNRLQTLILLSGKITKVFPLLTLMLTLLVNEMLLI